MLFRAVWSLFCVLLKGELLIECCLGVSGVETAKYFPLKLDESGTLVTGWYGVDVYLRQ